ncbi:Ankyrin repeat-containing protein ITN1 [Linum perenne]
MTKSNGKNALHLAARQGYVEIVSALLERDPQLARRTDKKGQTALHMAVKGVSSEVVRLLLSVDAAIVMSFKVFFIFNAVALFTSLAVVVVQITIVRGETNSARRVVEVINKLMWLASVCTTVAFISSAYIVVGRRNRWAAILITVIGGVTMAGVLGTMTFYVMKSRRIRRRKRREKSRNNGTGVPSSSRISDSEPEVNPIYAL